ncbi:hypothetical protein [Amycolatopsis taiwanensis]|uniref:hypothetical protein n=1 Tax=Amycolatopsis taiwanensis TaxID=342230 RepID=UPI000486A02F|nr:hypothetical protein [Amycolatopsis taiwanensis]
MIPYNVLPIEAHVWMIQQEQARIPVLLSAAQMFTEAHAWTQEAATQLQTNAGNLSPDWRDMAADSFQAKTGRSIADLKMWGDRIAGSQVSSQLTTLASTLPEALSTVLGLYGEYQAAISNIFTAGAAIPIWQASATRMTALGAQYDSTMLAVCAAAGVTNPGDLIPNFNISSADAVKTANAAVDFLTEVQSLAQSVGGGSGSLGSPSSLKDLNLPSSVGFNPQDWASWQGPSLAGLGASSLTAGASGGMPSLSPAGSAPVASLPPGAVGLVGSGLGGIPGLGGASGKRTTSSEAEIRPGAASSKTSGGGAVPPMMPQNLGAGGAGTLRPGVAEDSNGRSEGSHRHATAIDGVTAELRGRAGSSDGFVLPRGRRGESDTGTVELIEAT